MDEEIMTMVDNIAISFILGVWGIAVTVFTVIYSFMESAKERKRSLCDQVRNAMETDPVKESDLQFAIKRIHSLRQMNYVVIAIIILAIVAFMAHSVHLVLTQVYWLNIISLILLVVLGVVCLGGLIAYLVKYHKRFKGL